DRRRVESSVRDGLHAGAPPGRQVSYAAGPHEEPRLQSAITPRLRGRHSEKLMRVFVTGGTGYIGSRLTPALTARGHGGTALVRAGSARKAPAHCETLIGDPFVRATFARAISEGDTIVQLL